MSRRRRRTAPWRYVRVVSMLALPAGWLVLHFLSSSYLRGLLTAFLWGCASGLWLALGWKVLQLGRYSRMLRDLPSHPDPDEETLRRLGQADVSAGLRLWIRVIGTTALTQGVLSYPESPILLAGFALVLYGVLLWEAFEAYRELHRFSAIQQALLHRARRVRGSHAKGVLSVG